MASTPPQRRPINPAVLSPYLAKKKLKEGKILDDRAETVTFPGSEFVSVIRAEVGGDAPVVVSSYRVLVPIAQITRESADAFRRVVVAREDDIFLLRNLFIQHFGGVTMITHPPS